MTGIQEVDNLLLFALGGLAVFGILVAYLIFGIWKFYKTPKEQRGDNDPKVQYFILGMLLITFLTRLGKSQFNQVSTTSLVISVVFLCFIGYLFFIKKAKMAIPQVLVLSALALFSLFSIVMYFVK